MVELGRSIGLKLKLAKKAKKENPYNISIGANRVYRSHRKLRLRYNFNNVWNVANGTYLFVIGRQFVRFERGWADMFYNYDKILWV